MLKYGTKRRLVLALIGALILPFMIGAPLRRDYSTNYNGASAASEQVGIVYTNIHYGFPLAWLSLSKANGHGKAIVTKEYDKLVFDLGVWGLTVVFIGLVMRMDDVMLPPGARDMFKL